MTILFWLITGGLFIRNPMKKVTNMIESMRVNTTMNLDTFLSLLNLVRINTFSFTIFNKVEGGIFKCLLGDR